MKMHSSAVLRHSTCRGFTLLELLVVMVIIAILAALTVGAARYAQESSARNRTVTSHGAIQAALEQYKEKFGEYPEPANPTEDMTIGGSSQKSGGAHMLYQAITGDGSNAIRLASSTGSNESDGTVDDSERENVINFTNLPKSMIYPNLPAGTVEARVLIDGWSRPFQYTKGNADPTNSQAINPTYDLWSYGPSGGRAEATEAEAAQIKRDPRTTAPWIKNW